MQGSSHSLKRILVANDDGINAPGIIALLKQLIKVESYEIFVAAPAEEKSGQSHSITIHAPLQVERFHYQEEELTKVLAYKVHGTPADCVKISSYLLEDTPPDLILSGINRGNNAGMNVLYSGTVAAASEGCLQGIKAAALSLDHPITYPSPEDEWPYELAAELALPFIDELLRRDLPPGLILNLNFPNMKHRSEILGNKITQQGLSTFKSWYLKLGETQENMTFKVKGKMAVVDTEDHLDIYALRKGWVTCTPISIYRDTHNHPWVKNDLAEWTVFQKSSS